MYEALTMADRIGEDEAIIGALCACGSSSREPFSGSLSVLQKRRDRPQHRNVRGVTKDTFAEEGTRCHEKAVHPHLTF